MATLLLMSATLPFRLHADEGFWRFENPPVQLIQSQSGFAPDAAWLDHLKQSVLKVSCKDGGGTASFVSAEGLVLTNHHIVSPLLRNLSSSTHDYLEQGFIARERSQEVLLPGLKLELLVSSRDFTRELLAGLKDFREQEPGGNLSEAQIKLWLEKRLEQEDKRTGLRHEFAVQENPWQVWLHAYKRFDDVRLVMAPERREVGLGESLETETFFNPKMDICLLRAYEQGQPVKPAHHLKWSRQGLSAGGWTFSAGFPGFSQRRLPAAFALFNYGTEIPLAVGALQRRRAQLQQYSTKNAARAGQVTEALADIGRRLAYWAAEKKSRFIRTDQASFRQMRTLESSQRAELRDHKDLEALAGAAWDELDAKVLALETLAPQAQLLCEPDRNLLCGALETATGLVRLVREAQKPLADRLPGYYREEDIPKRLQTFLALQPLNRDLETEYLAFGLEELFSSMGSLNPHVIALLGDRSPRELAKEAISHTRIDQAAFLERLLEPGFLERCDDPLIRLAGKVETWRQEVDSQWRKQRQSVTASVEQIVEARRLLEGDLSYPDADSSLRFSFGKLQPAAWTGGASEFTRLGDIHETVRSPRWIQRTSKCPAELPLTFTMSNDFLPGSSGSPVVNQAGELVGLGYQSSHGPLAYLSRDFSGAVDVRAIQWLLADIYDAKPLVDELLGTLPK